MAEDFKSTLVFWMAVTSTVSRALSAIGLFVQFS
jgi:hypothetical protein